MGSKAPPPGKHALTGLAEGDFSGRPKLPGHPTTNRLLGRIADALQVPPAVLYNPPNAVTAGRGARAIKRHPELTPLRHEDLTPMLISHT